MENNITDKIQSLNTEERNVFKRIYKYVNNLNHVDWDNQTIDNKEYEYILSLVNKKMNDEDLSFDIGFKYFRNNKINLKRGVFVPQYDTEGIIDVFLKTGINSGRALEVGSGTGAISISLAKETNMEIDSIDINKDAIKLSKSNAKLNEVKINFFEQDVFSFHPKEKYDVLISNPPYVSKENETVEEWVEENQPEEALYADDKGYEFYKHIVLFWKDYVKNGGYLIFEIGSTQGKTLKLLANNTSMEYCEIIKDLEDNDRFALLKVVD